MKAYQYLIWLLLALYIFPAEAQKNQLRRNDKYSEASLPNNCDGIIYAVTLNGALLAFGNQNQDNERLEMTTLLPFRCNAIAKTFNNKILAVEAEKNTSLPVYEFSPLTRAGKYTKWKLPSHNDGGWISGGTDAIGRVYFATTTMKNLVRIDLRNSDVEIVWSSKDKIDGGNKIVCSEGCNFYINEKSDILIKENKKNISYKVSVEDGPHLTEIKNMEGFLNKITVNDWFEFANEKQQCRSLFVLKDAILLFKEGEFRPISIKVDTLRFGILTDIAGCDSKENRMPRMIINEKKEREILEAVSKKETIKLEKVFFKIGRSELQPQSYQELDEIVMILLKNKQLRILLEGHTDVTGDAEDNLQLSNERVNVCRDYLIKNGVSLNRINTKGYGSSKPLKTTKERFLLNFNSM